VVTKTIFEHPVSLGSQDISRLLDQYGCGPDQFAGTGNAFCERHLLSPAALAIAQFQDLLNLGREGRMNVPGRPEGNWRWRATQHLLSTRDFQWLGDLTKISNRSGSVQLPVIEAAS